MGNNPTGKTGKRYVSYPEPGVTKVYYENRVLVIRSDEDQKQYGAKLRAIQKQGHGKYPSDVVYTPQAPPKPKRAVKSKAPAKRTAPARKKAVRKSADDVWGKPPAPVYVNEEVKAAPKGPKYTIVAVCKTGRYDVQTADSREEAEHKAMNVHRYIPKAMMNDLKYGDIRENKV